MVQERGKQDWRHRLGVREKRIRIFTFDELSPKAKARAVKDFRNDPDLTWDQSDSDQLTEMFQQDLADHYHLGDMKVFWGLSHTQGDGVCFKGPVDIEAFVEAEGRKEEFAFLALPHVSARIKLIGHHCHSNSMEVEVESYSEPLDLLSREEREIFDRWENAAAQRSFEQQTVERHRYRPIEQWRRMTEAWKSKLGPRKQDWRPGPGPEPPPLDIPVPPDLEEPDDVRAIREKLDRLQQDLDRKLQEFREWLQSRVEELSKELAKNGYAEMEYHEGEEYALERLENMDWEYLEDGKRYDG